jgi:hypothetical protein
VFLSGDHLSVHEAAVVDQGLADKTDPVGITLVGGTGDQLWEKSRFQKASHWPFSLR